MRVNIGMPVVRTGGLQVVYGHVITKFSGMGRFTYPLCPAGALRSAIKFSMVSFIHTPSCTKHMYATSQAISVSSVPGHQSRCNVFSIFVHFQRLLGLILNLFGTYSQLK